MTGGLSDGAGVGGGCVARGTKKLFAHFPGHFCWERVMGQGGGGGVARGTKKLLAHFCF